MVVLMRVFAVAVFALAGHQDYEVDFLVINYLAFHMLKFEVGGVKSDDESSFFAIGDVDGLSNDHVNDVVSVAEAFPNHFRLTRKMLGSYEVGGAVHDRQLTEEDYLGGVQVGLDNNVAHFDEPCGVFGISQFN